MILSALLKMTAEGDEHAQTLNQQAANHEGAAARWIGKEHERGDHEEKSRGHDQQSRSFHRAILSSTGGGSVRLLRVGLRFEPESRFSTENKLLKVSVSETPL